MIAAKLELNAPSCEAAGGSRPTDTANTGAVPKIIARTKSDIAGYFFTNVDMIFISFLLDGKVGNFGICGALHRKYQNFPVLLKLLTVVTPDGYGDKTDA
jgi:hypothetical protein